MSNLDPITPLLKTVQSIAVAVNIKCRLFRGAWVAQSVKRATLAQVMILQFTGSSPTSGSVLTSQSPEPASDSVSPSLSGPPLLMLCLSLSQKEIKTLRNKMKIFLKIDKTNLLIL